MLLVLVSLDQEHLSCCQCRRRLIPLHRAGQGDRQGCEAQAQPACPLWAFWRALGINQGVGDLIGKRLARS